MLSSSNSVLLSVLFILSQCFVLPLGILASFSFLTPTLAGGTVDTVFFCFFGHPSLFHECPCGRDRVSQEMIERDLEKLGNVLKMRERSMLYGMKLETKLGRLNQMLEVRNGTVRHVSTSCFHSTRHFCLSSRMFG